MATNCSNNCDNCASVTTCHEAFGMKGHVHFEPRIAVINKYDGECTCCCQYVWPGGGIAFINELGMWEIRCKTHAPEMHGQALHMLNSCSGNCPNEPNPCGDCAENLLLVKNKPASITVRERAELCIRLGEALKIMMFNVPCVECVDVDHDAIGPAMAHWTFAGRYPHELFAHVGLECPIFKSELMHDEVLITLCKAAKVRVHAGIEKRVIAIGDEFHRRNGLVRTFGDRILCD